MARRYPGPTVVIAEAEDSSVYGVGVDSEWQDTALAWGGESCSAFLLAPLLEVSPQPARVVFNSRSRGAAQGLGAVDRKSGKQLVWIDGDFAACRRSFGEGCAPGLTCESGVRAIEVWGCGGLAGLRVQNSRNNVAKAVQERAGESGGVVQSVLSRMLSRIHSHAVSFACADQ